jgi:RNA polymerase sigma-70 factor (ECF subfamily)
MNLKAIRGVLHMNKEERGLTGRANQPVQEWVLTQNGFETDTEADTLLPSPHVPEARSANDSPDAKAHTSSREWETLLTENAPLAFRVARGVLRNDADAEDVAQEALVRAYQRLDRLRGREYFRAWLVRVAFRIALDRLRSTKRRLQREAQWVFENTRSTSPNTANADFQQHLERALEELPEKQRLVLLLAAMEGHTLEEVAGLLSIPMGTVKSRLFFAKKALAEKLRCFVNPGESL